MEKLKHVVEQIRNRTVEPSTEDMTLLEEMARELDSRLPIFRPNNPGFHRYGQLDLLAQEYIQYLPEIFNHERYVAIWTNPNGKKCP